MQVESSEWLMDPHARETAEVLLGLGIEPGSGVVKGLSEEDVGRRQLRYGRNIMQSVRGRSAWRIFLGQFASLVVGLLAVASVIAWITENRVESMAILLVLLINSLVGFLTEWQAGRALEALRKQTRSSARVRRSGSESMIDAGDLVPGDIVVLGAGDRVPADLRLLEAESLQVEESALTGESMPVGKMARPVAVEALLAERYSMLYLGTSVVAGRALAVVTATGLRTELGRIGRLVAEMEEEATPLRERLDELGRRLVLLVMAIGVIVVAAGWWRGDELWLMLETGISLAVAAVPEGLPAVTTLILALGVLRMARSNALVRHLPAVEALGSATVICTDKTGTLTENRMVVREYRLADGRTVSLASGLPDAVHDRLLQRAIETGVLCNEATCSPTVSASEGDGTGLIGDPTETSLLDAARRLGQDIGKLRAGYRRLAEEPFDAATKRMITVHHGPDGVQRICLKGAPAVVLDMCDHYVSGDGALLPADQAFRRRIELENEAMAGAALRVLGLAEKILPESSPLAMESGYAFLGLVGMFDPPRSEVAESIRRAYEAGIRVVMLTGDQIHTARAIASELRIGEEGRLTAMHARDLPIAGSPGFLQVAGEVQVFARVSPEDKLRIVEALQQAGEVVAVTGDGVNDAPALKRADIGVAMGMRGTETAREAADIVLTDDNFATILRAVEGGRTIYANLLKFVRLMLSENLAEVIFIFFAIILGWPLPLLPLQILWVNLLTDIFPALALAVEPPSPDIMKRPPRPPREAMLSSRFFLLIGWQGVMLATICLAGYQWALQVHGSGDRARTIALLMLIGAQVGHLFNCRSLTASAFRGLFRNVYLWISVAIVIALQVMAVTISPLMSVLETTTIDQRDLLMILVASILPVGIVEAVKFVARNSQRRKGR